MSDGVDTRLKACGSFSHTPHVGEACYMYIHIGYKRASSLEGCETERLMRETLKDVQQHSYVKALIDAFSPTSFCFLGV